jgi:hypothetical protein
MEIFQNTLTMRMPRFDDQAGSGTSGNMASSSVRQRLRVVCGMSMLREMSARLCRCRALRAAPRRAAVQPTPRCSPARARRFAGWSRCTRRTIPPAIFGISTERFRIAAEHDASREIGATFALRRDMRKRMPAGEQAVDEILSRRLVLQPDHLQLPGA